MTRKEVLYKAIETYGEEHQKQKAVEECSEFINAIAKESDGRAGSDDVITEIADVFVTMYQMAVIYGEIKVAREIVYKIDRLRQRMNYDTEQD